MYCVSLRRLCDFICGYRYWHRICGVIADDDRLSYRDGGFRRYDTKPYSGGEGGAVSGDSDHRAGADSGHHRACGRSGCIA